MKNTKLYKFLFEEIDIVLDPEISSLYDEDDNKEQDASLFEMIFEDTEAESSESMSGADAPDGQIVSADPSFSPESLTTAAASYDSGLQGLIVDPETFLVESYVFEASAERGGINQQQAIVDKLKKILAKGIKAVSNTKGSTLPDVVVKTDKDEVIGQFECKSAQGSQTEVTFFDATVQAGGIGAETFLPLLQKIAVAKKLKFFEKKGNMFTEIVGAKRTALLADKDKLVEAMITVASDVGSAPGCGKYGDLDGPEWSDNEWYSIEEAIADSSEPRKDVLLRKWQGKWSTHRPQVYNGNVVFLPLMKGESVKNAHATQARVYFWWEDEAGNDIYKYVSIKSDKGKYLKLSDTKRESGDSGALKTSCFRVAKFEKTNMEHEAIKATAAEIISEHFEHGKDTYFAIAKGNNIKVFRTGAANPLRLVSKRGPPPIFGANYLLSAGVGTYGTGGPNKIRMGLKCHIAVDDVPNLDDYTVKRGA